MIISRIVTVLLLGWIIMIGSAICQTIPDNRLVNWSLAGLTGDFIYPDTEIDVTDFGATGNGNANDAPAIQSAINSLNGNAGVVVLPAGIYLMNVPLSIKDSIILAGKGSDSTILIFNLGGQATNCINISSGQNTGFQNVLSGFEKGSIKLTVSNPEVFLAGDFAEIRQQNGPWDTNPVSWADYSVGQMVRVTHIAGDTLFLESALRFTYDENLNPEIRKINPKVNTGVENLKIIRQDEPAEGAGSNINLSYAVNCRIAGMESDQSVGSHINMHYCSNIQITGCYVHDAFTYDGSGTRGYGVCLSMHTGESLITNNIFDHLRHAMMVKTGSNGNVFAYNYSRDPHRSEPISDFSGDISLHGHFAYANLFEGNICQNIIIDHYWGPSGPYNSFLRNRAEWYGLIMTNPNGYATNSQNFIANEITENGYNFWIQLWYGLYYVLTGNDHFEWGNNSGGEIIPAGTAQTNVNSYYLESPPFFWDDEIPWPSIGWPNSFDQETIPAKLRYDAGSKLTTDPLPITTQTMNIPAGWSGISSFIAPFRTEIDNLFGRAAKDIIILYNYENIYYPGQNIYTLSDWNYRNGYIIKSDSTHQIRVSGIDRSGQFLEPEQDWIVFPVLSSSPVNVSELDAKYDGNIQVVKEIAGPGVYWPGQQIYTLNWLQPGKAYLLKLSASREKFP